MSTTVFTADSKICIIGGGPGGCFTSLQLSKAGIPHILLEKSAFPRDKVCGEVYDGRVLHGLRKIEPLYIKELMESGRMKLSWACEVHVSDSLIRRTYPSTSPKMLINRPELDDFLMNKVKSTGYADVRKAFVRNIEEVGDIVNIYTDQGLIRSSLAVIASGSMSTLSQHSKDEKYQCIFARAYFKNVNTESLRVVKFYVPQHPVPHLLLVCPIGNNEVMVEVGVPKDYYAAQEQHVFDIMKQSLQETHEVKEAFNQAEIVGKSKGTFMNLDHFGALTFTEGRKIYVGSSALSVNPITGFGIGNAVAMSQAAVESILPYVGNKEGLGLEVCNVYNKLARKRLRTVINLNRIVNLLMRYSFKYPKYMKLFWKPVSWVLDQPFGDMSHERPLPPYIAACMETADAVDQVPV